MTAISAVVSTWIVTTSQRLGAKDRGATAVEYGLMVALIAVVIIGAVTLLGDNLSTLFNAIAEKIGAVTP